MVCAHKRAGCTPLNLANGGVSYSDGLSIGSTAIYACDFGYQLSGGDMQNCTTAGWTSGQDATCGECIVVAHLMEYSDHFDQDETIISLFLVAGVSGVVVGDFLLQQ